MSTYGSETTRVFARKDLAVVKIGGDTYALANYVECYWEYGISEDDVLGTDKPVQGTGHFRGRIIIRRIYSTDKDLLTLQAPVNGMVPETTIQYLLKDTQGTPVTKTWTIKARLNRIRHLIQVGQFVIAEATGILTDIPTAA